MKKTKRRHVMRQISEIVNGYTQCSSILSEILLPTHKLNVIGELPPDKDSNIFSVIDKMTKKAEFLEEKLTSDHLEEDSIDEESFSDNNSIYSEDECTVSKEECTLAEENCTAELVQGGRVSQDMSLSHNNSSTLPDWLLEYCRKGKIQSCVMDIVNLHQCFLTPQVEDVSLPSAHLISLNILSVLVTLLLGQSGPAIKCWVRIGTRVNSCSVGPSLAIGDLKLPSVGEILEVEISVRKELLLTIVETSVDLSQITEDWHLFIIASIFWLKNMKTPVASKCHLYSIVLCLVCIYTFDMQLGFHRNRSTFMKKYKNLLNKLLERRKEDKNTIEQLNPTSTPPINLNCTKEQSNPKTQYYRVTHEDCVIMFETVLPYHHLNEQLKAKPKTFNLSTVHAFSQFQSCLFHIMLLNSLLGFPFKQTVVSHLFSGTFAYNIFTNLSKRKDAEAYIETLLCNGQSLLRLFKALVHFLESALGSTDLYKKKVRKNQRKKKSHKKTLCEEFVTNELEDELYVDANNRFSALSLHT